MRAMRSGASTTSTDGVYGEVLVSKKGTPPYSPSAEYRRVQLYVGYTQAEIGLKVLDGTRLSEYDEYRTVLPTGFKPSTVVL